MDKGQLYSVRRFGHRPGTVRSQMPQSCASRAIWPPTAVAKSPYRAELTFVQLCDVPPVLWGSLRGYFAGSILARFDPAKDSAK